MLLMAVLVTLIGCQSKVTRNRFEMIHVGSDDKYLVELALGRPVSQSTENFWRYAKNGMAATICFDDDGMVQTKKWIDDRTGEVASEP
jgi:hypothetical protein